MLHSDLKKELKYYKVFNDIKEKILSYDLPSDTQLLGIRELMKHYNVSYATITKALDELEKYNLIKRCHGQGIFVESKNLWNIKKNDKGFIGLIVTDMSIPFFGKVINIVEKEFNMVGYDVMIRNSDFSSAKERKIIETFIDGKAKGIIIVPTFDDENINYLQSVDHNVVPLVYIIRYKSPNCNYVVPEYYEGVYNAIEYFIKMGHTSIGYIAGEQVKNKDISFMAYKDCLNKYGLEYKDQWVIREKYFEVYSGYECMKKLLNSAELPTAIFCYTDSMAVGAMKACREKGLVIPEDISIIGCNNDDISQFVEPQIATIMNPVETICKFAVKAVHELINKNKSDNHLIQLKIPMEFIERKSVKNLADMKNKNK